jgi:hypothetical protein
MADRYLTCPDRQGFSVVDVWTGEIAAIARVPQTGLSREDADQLAAMLNTRARNGDRTVRQ